MIWKVSEDKIDEINENIGRDLSNHGNSNDSSKTRHLKFISF